MLRGELASVQAANILMKHGDEKWTAESAARISSGTEIPVYIDKNSIMTIGK